MLVNTDNPVLDYQRYVEALDEAFERSNRKHVCAICGKPCGAYDHYEIFKGVYACSNECAKKIIKEEDMLDEVVDDWVEDHKIDPCPLK